MTAAQRRPELGPMLCEYRYGCGCLSELRRRRRRNRSMGRSWGALASEKRYLYQSHLITFAEKFLLVPSGDTNGHVITYSKKVHHHESNWFIVVGTVNKVTIIHPNIPLVLLSDCSSRRIEDPRSSEVTPLGVVNWTLNSSMFSSFRLHSTRPSFCLGSQVFIRKTK